MFKRYIPALVDAVKNEQIKKVPIGELAGFTMVHLPFPYFKKYMRRNEDPEWRYALTLPDSVRDKILTANLFLKKEDVTMYRCDELSIGREDLVNTEGMRDADLVLDAHHLVPCCFCLVDKGYKADVRGRLKTEDKKKQVLDAIDSSKELREVSFLSEYGYPRPKTIVKAIEKQETETTSFKRMANPEKMVMVVMLV